MKKKKAAKKTKKREKMQEPFDAWVVDLTTDQSTGFGYYLAFDDILEAIALGVVGERDISAHDFLYAIKEFIKDIETGQLDLESLFDYHKATRPERIQ